LYSGAFIYTYPIAVPPGTNNLQPTIAINYNNHNAKQKANILGSGWTLSQSYIQRDVNFTFNDTSDDSYQLILDGNTYNLIFSLDDNKYHPKIVLHNLLKNPSRGITSSSILYVI